MRNASVLILICLFAGGCDTSVIPDQDYRDAFIGDYIGLRTNSSWTLNGPGTSSQTADTVSVMVSGDSSLFVQGTEIHINPDGTYFLMPWPSNYYSVTFFSGDSLETDQNSGGLGGAAHTNFKGRRN